MIDDFLHTAYQKAWWALFLRGLLALAVGVFVLWRPLESIASLALVIALWAVFNGIVEIVRAIDLRAAYRQWWVLLLSGFVSVGFGIAALYYYPALSLAFAVLWVTWWLFITGFLAIYAALMERRMGLPFGWTIAAGIVSVVAGAFALMSPPATLAAILGLVAGFAIIVGVVLLTAALRLTAAKQDIASAMRSARA